MRSTPSFLRTKSGGESVPKMKWSTPVPPAIAIVLAFPHTNARTAEVEGDVRSEICAGRTSAYTDQGRSDAAGSGTSARNGCAGAGGGGRGVRRERDHR